MVSSSSSSLPGSLRSRKTNAHLPVLSLSVSERRVSEKVGGGGGGGGGGRKCSAERKPGGRNCGCGGGGGGGGGGR